MSIWASVDIGSAKEVDVLLNETDASNYRGEGAPDAWVDVATARSWHQLIRFSITATAEGRGDVAEVLIAPAAARLLAARLIKAADFNEQSPRASA